MKFYSEKLDKLFESEKELTTAEKEFDEAEAKKAEAKALVKKESAAVEDAFKARNAARKVYNTKLVELRKAYNEVIKKARDDFDAGLSEASKELQAKEEAYDKALKEFVDKHPEGYRITLHDGDNVTTLSGVGTDLRSAFDETQKFWDNFFNLLRF